MTAGGFDALGELVEVVIEMFERVPFNLFSPLPQRFPVRHLAEGAVLLLREIPRRSAESEPKRLIRQSRLHVFEEMIAGDLHPHLTRSHRKLSVRTI